MVILTVLLCRTAWAQSAADANAHNAADDAHRERLHELARTLGPTAFELAEAWLALGFQQRETGRHAEAVRSFETALHIERVHKGLTDPEQIPLLERIAESNRALADWRAVEQNYRLVRWINAEGRDATDPARLETLARLARWQLEAADLPTGRPPFEHLRDAADLAGEAVSLTERHHGAARPELIDALVLQAAAAHRIAHHMSSWAGEPVRGVTQDALVTSATNDAGDFFFRQNFVVSNYATGRAALERAAELAAGLEDPVRHARCEQLLGDWHLLFGRRHASAEHYRRAQTLAAGADVDLFARPRQLPNFVESTVVGRDTARTPEAFVRTRFDIDPQGRARNVEILEVSPSGRHVMARQARQQLREMRFRPRFVHGKAVKSEGVEIRIVFPQPEKAGGAVQG